VNKSKMRVFIAIILFLALIILFLHLFSPLGLKAIYRFSYPNPNWIKNIFGISSVTDWGSIDGQIKHLSVTSDKANFSIVLPPAEKNFSRVNVSMSFKTKEEAKLCITNDFTGEVESIAFFQPVLQNLQWPATAEDGLVLYQKNIKYNSMNEFFEDKSITASDGKGVGVYDYKLQSKIDDAIAPDKDFTLDGLIRGSHTFYVFVKKEPLVINVEKSDLNQYVGKDELEITIEENGRSILYTLIEDDGVEEKTLLPGRTQSATIEKKLPQGVYKVKLTSSSDSVITNLRVNQGLVVFEGLFFVDNPAVYPIAKEYKKHNIFTDSSVIDFALARESEKQNIFINGEEFPLNQKNNTIDLNSISANLASPTNSRQKINEIEIHKNDVNIQSKSVFSLTREAFFKPYLSQTTEINNSVDVTKLDFIIGKYKKADEENGWYKQTLSIPVNIDSAKQKEVQFSIFKNEMQTRFYEWLSIKDLTITLE